MKKAYVKNNPGFTIVELLIVIVVIAILATISIVAYNGIQDRAKLSAVHSDLVNAKKKLMLYSVEEGGYPKSTAELTAAGVAISDASNYDNRPSYSNYYYCADLEGNNFALGARAGNSQASSFYISSNSDITPLTGLISQSITCGTIGLTGSTSAQGAYSLSGLSSTGAISSWLR